MSLAFDEVKTLVIDVLQLGSHAADFNQDTILMGNIAEFDSMAVVAILTSIEDMYDVEIDDDEIDVEIFETLGTLYQFIKEKVD